jgi:hypothetical protein
LLCKYFFKFILSAEHIDDNQNFFFNCVCIKCVYVRLSSIIRVYFLFTFKGLNLILRFIYNNHLIHTLIDINIGSGGSKCKNNKSIKIFFLCTTNVHPNNVYKHQ